MRKSIQNIYAIMPEGWREAAKTEGALRRGRNIQTPEELLRLLILHVTEGGSLGVTSAITQISEDQKGLNKTAVHKRILNSWKWEQWLCKHSCQQEGFLVEPPKWLENHRVCIVDASDYAKPGSNQADFRLHYQMELFSLSLVEMHFTTAKEGETLQRYEQIRENDLIIADRGYCTKTSIFHVLDHHADYAIRMRSNSFQLYTETGERFDLTKVLSESYAPGRILDLTLFMKRDEALIPIRICAVGKSKEAIQQSQRQIKKANPGRKPASTLQKIWSHYVVVATSLGSDMDATKILELYRMRWQIELVFKRFKSIFSGRKFTAKREDAIKAWFYGKLLVAILCEALVRKGRFSPSEEKKVH